jgi:large subunit ribosomal protein L17
MTASLLAHGRIETTQAKAKELRSFAERTISKAVRLRREMAQAPRRGSVEAARARLLQLRRLLAARLPAAVTMPGEDGERLLSRRDLVSLLVGDIAGRYLARPGGYTRIRKLGARRGDNAPLVVLELVPGEVEKAEAPPGKEAGPAKQRRFGFFRRSKAEAAAEDEKRDKK